MSSEELKKLSDKLREDSDRLELVESLIDDVNISIDVINKNTGAYEGYISNPIVRFSTSKESDADYEEGYYVVEIPHNLVLNILKNDLKILESERKDLIKILGVGR